MRRVVLAIFALLLLPACRSDRVPLTYRLEPGLRLEHLLTLRAEITRTLSGQTRGQDVEASFLAGQEILAPLAGGGAEAAVSLVPQGLEVDGQPVDLGPAQEYTVELAPDGRVVAVRVAAGDQAQALQPVGIERLLPRLRPVLPGRPVAPGESWRSETEFADQHGRFSLTTRSRLAQLGMVGEREAALVRTTYESPVDRQEVFANAVADVVGSDVGAQEAWFSLQGYLVRAVGDSVGTYRVTFMPPGEEEGAAPVQGALVVRLHLEMVLLSADGAAG